jgi:PIN domain nuclease of toxin-antitoxin system
VAAVIHLDTHVVVWLHAGREDLLSHRAREAIEAEEIAVSPMVLLELEYLREVGKTTEGAATVLGELQQQVGLRIAEAQFLAVISCAQRQSWTRDPFDRIIVAQAETEGCTLVTRDQSIRDHCSLAVW